MSTIFITNVVGIGTYAVPTDDAQLAAAQAGFTTLLSGVAGLAYNTATAWVRTRSGGGASRTLDCYVDNVTYFGEVCPDSAEILTLTTDIENALEADPQIFTVNVQFVDLQNTPAALPAPHASTHENGGSDEISVAGLSGLLADDQNPVNHAASHQNGGGDEISVAGLSGLLADDQNPVNHAASHQNGGGDEISVAGLSGLLADDQNPVNHAASHQNGGGDEISVAGLSGLLADDQNPVNHAASHQNGGGDEISVAGLSGLLADDQNPVNHGSDHNPDGSDPTAIASAIEITDATSGAGSANSLTRSDHQHAHGNRGGGALHAAVTTGVNGFMSAADKTKLDALFVPAYGSIGAENQGNALLLTLQSTFYKYVEFEFLGASQNTTPSVASDYIQIDVDGDYLVQFNMSFQGTAAGNSYEWALFTDAGISRIFNCQGEHGIWNTTTEYVTISAQTIVALTSGQQIQLWARCPTAAGTLVRGRDGSLSVLRVG